jgi:hypothetical protein
VRTEPHHKELSASQQTSETYGSATIHTGPWQLDPSLPTNVTIDLTNHHTKALPAPPGWEILQRNGHTLITHPNLPMVSLDQAQFGMLRELYGAEQPDQQDLSVSFLPYLRESCLAQPADGISHVPWRGHLLACLHRITQAELLGDQRLGTVLDCPWVEALLLLDSFEPRARTALWRRVDAHASTGMIHSVESCFCHGRLYM